MTYRNPILATDSYKHSHFLQYPPEAKRISAYVEARANPFSDRVQFLGLQKFMMDLVANPITIEDVVDALHICDAHGIPFNLGGWTKIVEEFDGKLPIEISALPEGSIVPTGVPLIQVVNTDDRFPWLATFIETALLRAIWYPTTVGTLSWMCKQIIRRGLEISSDDPEGQLPFKLHDFGARGVSSAESAAIGGFAHLANFQGTDTMEALTFARHYYDAKMPGFSIPAAEHSTMTSWGRDGETYAYLNMLDKFEGEGKLVAVVSDSYDLDNAVENIWGGALRKEVLSRKGTLVVRPDSGCPIETPIRVLKKLWRIFGGHTNGKGYKVLHPNVRVIQGDGMNIDSIAVLVARVIEEGFSIDNIAFGMGGGLLQKVDRDTLRFAMKANAMLTADGWKDVAKRPATDPTKGSKAGRQAVILDKDGKLEAVPIDSSIGMEENLLQPIYRNGEILRFTNIDEIRQRGEAA